MFQPGNPTPEGWPPKAELQFSFVNLSQGGVKILQRSQLVSTYVDTIWLRCLNLDA